MIISALAAFMDIRHDGGQACTDFVLSKLTRVENNLPH